MAINNEKLAAQIETIIDKLWRVCWRCRLHKPRCLRGGNYVCFERTKAISAILRLVKNANA